MDELKKQRLEYQGWKVGKVKEFQLRQFRKFFKSYFFKFYGCFLFPLNC